MIGILIGIRVQYRGYEMSRKLSVLSISLPPDLDYDLDSAARQERLSPNEPVREAVRQYVLLARWKTLRQKAALKAVEQGLKDENIERLVDEKSGARRRY